MEEIGNRNSRKKRGKRKKPPEATLTVAQSAQSIAVELARANEIATQALKLQAAQAQQTQLVLKALDRIAEISERGHELATGSGQQNLLSEVMAMMRVPLEVMAQGAARPPKIDQSTSPKPPPPVAHHANGTKVSATEVRPQEIDP